MSQSSNGLEQIGTEADCSSRGQAVYSAWYELIPDGPHTLAMTIKPGDVITARVRVVGNVVAMRLNDTTTGARFFRTFETSNIDVSSAEWITEAPSACSGNSFCQPLAARRLPDGRLLARPHRGRMGTTGTISDPGVDRERDRARRGWERLRPTTASS